MFRYQSNFPIISQLLIFLLTLFILGCKGNTHDDAKTTNSSQVPLLESSLKEMSLSVSNGIYSESAFTCKLSETHAIIQESHHEHNAFNHNIAYACEQFSEASIIKGIFEVLEPSEEFLIRLHEIIQLNPNPLLTISHFWLDQEQATIRFDSKTQWQLQEEQHEPHSEKVIINANMQSSIAFSNKSLPAQAPETRTYLAVIVRTKSDNNDALTFENVSKRMSTGNPNVFGDSIADQFKLCSGGALEFLPFDCDNEPDCTLKQQDVEGVSAIQNGVVEVSLDIDSSLQTSPAAVRNLALNKIFEKWQMPTYKHPHILSIVPPDVIYSTGNGSAYALNIISHHERLPNSDHRSIWIQDFKNNNALKVRVFEDDGSYKNFHSQVNYELTILPSAGPQAELPPLQEEHSIWIKDFDTDNTVIRIFDEVIQFTDYPNRSVNAIAEISDSHKEIVKKYLEETSEEKKAVHIRSLLAQLNHSRELSDSYTIYIQDYINNQSELGESDFIKSLRKEFGAIRGLIAIGGTNSWQSTFHATWFFDQRARMHELGHNLGLGHAFDDVHYWDKTGYLANTGWEPIDKISRCFNAANLYQLGWHRETTITLPEDHSAGIYQVFGITDADQVNVKANQATIIYLGESKADSEKYFLSFNRANSFNEDSERGRNQLYLVRTFNAKGKTVRPKQQPKLDKTTLLEGFYEDGDLAIYYDNLTLIDPFTASVSIINTGKTKQSAEAFFSNPDSFDSNSNHGEVSEVIEITNVEATKVDATKMDKIESDSLWQFCAKEGSLCQLPLTTEVRYGAKETFVTKSFSQGPFACNNATFGDPLPGYPKYCEYWIPQTGQTQTDAALPPDDPTIVTHSPSKAQTLWQFCAKEGSLCQLPLTTEVRYGAKETFVTKSFSQGPFACNNTTFGDPLPGYPKYCEYWIP